MKNRIKDSLIIELCTAEGKLSEWVTIFPAPDEYGWVQGRDGRKFLVEDADAVMGLTMGRGVDLRLDYEHASEIKAPKGEEAPAAGWFTELRVAADGSIEGKLDPTDRARRAVQAREYRYLSPVPITERVSRKVHRFSSVALTNEPNLYIAALNREASDDPSVTTTKPHTMKEEELKELCRELGIAEDSKPTAILAAAKKVKTEASLNREATPSLEKFVPRADFDAVTERARNAEQKNATREQEQLDAEINREIDAAVEAGKITPATKGFYRENCRAEDGLDRFRKFVKSAPVIGDPSGIDGMKPPEVGAELNSEEKTVCDQMGIDPKEFKKTRDAEVAAATA